MQVLILTVSVLFVCCACVGSLCVRFLSLSFPLSPLSPLSLSSLRFSLNLPLIPYPYRFKMTSLETHPVVPMHESNQSIPATSTATSVTIATNAATVASVVPVGLEAGFPCDLFVKPLKDELMCVICLHAVRLPLNLGCSHVFCKSCLSTAMVTKQTCPTCQTPITEQITQYGINTFVVGLINKKTIRCPHHLHGCKATYVIGVDERNHINHLLNVCEYERQLCDCGDKVHPSRLAAHHATDCLWACPKCNEVMTRDLKLSHTSNVLQCINFATCPYGCHQTTDVNKAPVLKKRKLRSA
jgi:hypothetical protein